MMRTLWAWFCRANLVAATGGAVAGLAVIGLRYPMVLGIFAVAAILKLARRPDGGGTSHGSARVATQAEIDAHGLYSDGHDGLIFGRALGERPSKLRAVAGLISPFDRSETAVERFNAAFLGGRAYRDRFVHIKDFNHVLTVAPSGCGKNVSSVILNLLHYSGNTLVFDPKGENFQETHRHRAKVFGHYIIRLDPTGMHGPGDTFNVLDMLDPTRIDYLESCRDIAAMLVSRTGQEHDTHWLDSCEIVCMAIIAFVCSCVDNPAKRNFATFRLIVSSPKNFADALAIMQGRPDCRGLIEMMGNQLSWYQGKELNSILTTVHRMTGFLDSPMVADNTAVTSFPLDILKTGRADAFLVIPPPMMSALSPLVRLWLGCFTRLFTQDGASERKKLLVIVDEAAVLGRQKAIEEGITLMRGYGLRIWLIFQSLGQARTCFGENADVVIDNLTTQQYFCISSLETAKILSERIGDATLFIKTLNDTTGSSYQAGGGPNNQTTHNASRSVSTAPHARRLLQPNEIMNLPGSVGMLFHKNMHMIPVKLARYYNAPEFAERRRHSRIRGTGRPVGLGLAVGAKTAAALIASLVFIATMVALTEPGSTPQPNTPFNTPGYYGQGFNGSPMPYTTPPATYRRPPSRSGWRR